MIIRIHPTLRQVFGFSLLGLLMGLGALFFLVWNGSERTILRSSEDYRTLASRAVEQRVTSYLNEAPYAITQFERKVKYGLIETKRTDSIEEGLLSLLLVNENLSEATFTYANSRGLDADGNILTDRDSAGQVAVLRSVTGSDFICKRTWFDGSKFISTANTFTAGSTTGFSDQTPLEAATNPTAHATFQTAIQSDNRERAISSDLHWTQLDEGLPEAKRRVEVSVQKSLNDPQGRFAGVLRVGLMKTQIDRAVQQHITGLGGKDPYSIFLCDNMGRLITGFGDRDKVTISGDDLRIAPYDVPAVVARALEEPALRNIDAVKALAATSFRTANRTYLCTFRYLPGTQDWIVGIVVPQDFYLGPLLQVRQEFLSASLALIVSIILAGTFIIRGVVRAHSLISRETARMKEFHFSPVHRSSRLRDIQEVLVGLEKAKTAMRAMSKYVPVNLVRQLYLRGEEPILGGKSAELSVMFSDIKDFTAFAESTTPDKLAEMLGHYLQVMAETIQAAQGTIDKYIGDSVMTFWNAPEPVAGHEVLACRSALRCREALQELYASPTWGQAPQFETRFGLHCCVASVGHFGAPDRMNYTAIGDGINLASRLEGLSKYYGTNIIVSESIHAVAKDAFEFRVLDRVAVKGKTECLMIYELLSERTAGNARPAWIDRYEEAFEAYQRGDFAAALMLLQDQGDDGPSHVLASRCHEFLNHPPRDWRGIYVFDSK